MTTEGKTKHAGGRPSLNSAYWQGFDDGVKAEQNRRRSSHGARLETALLGTEAGETREPRATGEVSGN